MLQLDAGLTEAGTAVVNEFVNDCFDCIVAWAIQIANYRGTTKLCARTIQDAIKLALPSELAKHSISEGSKGVYMLFIIN